MNSYNIIHNNIMDNKVSVSDPRLVLNPKVLYKLIEYSVENKDILIIFMKLVSNHVSFYYIENHTAHEIQIELDKKYDKKCDNKSSLYYLAIIEILHYLNKSNSSKIEIHIDDIVIVNCIENYTKKWIATNFEIPDLDKMRPNYHLLLEIHKLKTYLKNYNIDIEVKHNYYL